MTADIKLQQLHLLCEETNKAWNRWFSMTPGEHKTLARWKYLNALNEERRLYDVIMQEDEEKLTPS